MMMDCATVSMDVDHGNHSDGLLPTLQNIVATVSFGCPLELTKIALKARNAEYNPRRFGAVIMRIKEPKTTFLIFASGKVVCTGAKSEEQSKIASRKCARIIQKLGYPVTFQNFKIQNMVGACDVKFLVRLETLNCGHLKQNYAYYEPEVFPGLVFRMKQPNVVILVFSSGKIVLTGAKVREEIYQAFDNIYPLLVENKKTQSK